MTDTASPVTPQAPIGDEDAKLAELGYTQKLDRSVGTVASFAIGFATISATTAVFTGFGAGYFTAGAPFVWTLLLAGAVFALWAFIAADLTAKLPLAGYSYQWISRINGPDLGFFTGFIALMGWVCGMTGVGFILSGYLGGLFGWSMSQSAQILLAIGVVFLCVLINIYGVRFATMVNNIGVSLELVITVGATALVAIIAFSAPENHQPISVLFTGGESGDKDSYMLAWLAAALGPFFGLIGVESGADVAEETKNARHVVPKTMFYALVTSIVIELLMYIVFVLAIRDADAVEANGAAPIEEIINQQAGPVVTKIIVAVALTNILACLLANILVATRLTYSMARDNMLPFSNVWRHVSAKTKTPTYAVLGLGCLSTAAAVVGARQREGVQLHHRHRVVAVLLRLHPADHRAAGWLPQGHHPRAGARHLRPGPVAVAALPHRACGLPRSRRCPALPASVHQQQVGVPWRGRSRRRMVGHRAAVAVEPRRRRVGLRQDPSELNSTVYEKDYLT